MRSPRFFDSASLFGLRSFRGRYLYFAGLLSLVLAIAALVGRAYVERTSEGQIHNIQQRSKAAIAVSDMLEQNRSLETAVQRFLILPDDKNRHAVKRASKLQQTAVARLRSSRWVAGDRGLSELAKALSEDSRALADEIEKLVATRQDVEAWFPAMSTMQRQMLPANRRFSAALDLAIAEARDGSNTGRTEIFTTLVRIRHTWTRMVSEFRLYVSNRFGIFSNDPETGMLARSQNIAIFSQRVSELLADLEQMDHAGALDIQQQRSLSEMRLQHQRWQTGYNRVSAILQSEGWRSDLVSLREDIDPLFSRIRNRLSTLQLELGVGSARDITKLTAVAKGLSGFVILLAVASITLVVGSFLIFNLNLLRPIALIAQAMKAEARGDQGVVIPSAKAEETRDLIDAFSEMREQVRTRQSHLDFLAHHDPVTALPNRILFRDRLRHALDQSARQGTLVGLLFLDLDRFKQINDSIGHDVGDRLLQAVAERLLGYVRQADTVARLGGDEFAILIENISHRDQAETVVEKIQGAFSEHFLVKDQTLHVTASIGVALCPTDDNEVDLLIKDADIAMYHAKELGRDTYQFYSADMTTKVTEHLELEMRLRRAVEQRDFTLAYQPVLELEEGRITACEALLRWNHPERGAVSPVEILPVLEDTGLIVPVSQWIVEEVLLRHSAWQRAGAPLTTISVNLSGRLLQAQSFVDFLIHKLETGPLPPSGLIVEVTEDTLMHDFRAADRVLRQLKDMGVRIALDDFGTGQSSLNHVRRFPIDIVKIDRDFVRDVPGDRYDSDLVKAIVALAHSLEIQVIAEGVETHEQLSFLKQQNCGAMQGFLASAAVPGDAMLEFLLSDRRLLED